MKNERMEERERKKTSPLLPHSSKIKPAISVVVAFSLFSLLSHFAMSKSAKQQQQTKLPDELVEKLETALLLALSKQGDGASSIDSGEFAASFGLKPIDVVGLVKSLTGAEMVEAKVRFMAMSAVASFWELREI